MSDHQHDDAGRYRSLFEGSQASLTDMAARHAQTLGRVGRLRSAIVSVLRKNFMELSAQAEANLGRRLSEVDDEILLAYLDAFTGMASRSDQRATLQALGEAIAALGIPLRGDDPLVWVEQIHRHRQEQQQRQQRSLGWGTASESPSGDDGRRPTDVENGRSRHDDAPEQGVQGATRPEDESAGRDVEDYWQWDDRPSLHELFADAPSTQPLARPTTEDRAEAGSLGGLFRDITEPPIWDDAPIDEGSERWTPSPVRPSGTAGTDAAAPDGDRRTAGGRRKTKGSTPRSAEPRRSRDKQPAADRHHSDTSATTPSKTQGESGIGEGSEDRTSPHATPVGEEPQPRRLDPIPSDRQGDISDHHDVEGSHDAVGANDSGAPVIDASGDQAPQQTGIASAVQGNVHDMVRTVGHDTDEGGAAAATERTPTGGTASDPAAIGVPAAKLPDTLIGAPLRPELFPTTAATKKPRKGRTVRTQAQAPQETASLLDAVNDGSSPSELDDQLRAALIAAASIPRPVFTRDLVAVAGDIALVDAWEAECRANVSTSPVRFVVPKSRHRLRGRLVAVEPENAKPTDWWYQAVSRYRAGRLYELGVLLHRIGDEVVSFQLDEHVALFRLNTQRGLVGVVISLEARPADTPEARAQLADALERLLSERLTLLTVLTASAEQGALEQLSAVVDDISRERRFTPTFPLLAARSWEYADDRGSSAVLIQGES